MILYLFYRRHILTSQIPMCEHSWYTVAQCFHVDIEERQFYNISNCRLTIAYITCNRRLRGSCNENIRVTLEEIGIDNLETIDKVLLTYYL